MRRMRMRSGRSLARERRGARLSRKTTVIRTSTFTITATGGDRTAIRIITMTPITIIPIMIMRLDAIMRTITSKAKARMRRG